MASQHPERPLSLGQESNNHPKPDNMLINESCLPRPTPSSSGDEEINQWQPSHEPRDTTGLTIPMHDPGPAPHAFMGPTSHPGFAYGVHDSDLIHHHQNGYHPFPGPPRMWVSEDLGPSVHRLPGYSNIYQNPHSVPQETRVRAVDANNMYNVDNPPKRLLHQANNSMDQPSTSHTTHKRHAIGNNSWDATARKVPRRDVHENTTSRNSHRLDTETDDDSEDYDSLDNMPSTSHPRKNQASSSRLSGNSNTTTQRVSLDSLELPHSRGEKRRRRIHPDEDDQDGPSVAVNSRHEIPHETFKQPYKANRKHPERDPINHIIKDLRMNERMSWGEIAAEVNNRLVAAGKRPTCSESSAYGRFKRNAPRVAEYLHEPKLDPGEWMYLRPKKVSVVGSNTSRENKKERERELKIDDVPDNAESSEQYRFSEKEHEALADAYMEASPQLWQIVAEIMNESVDGEHSYTANECLVNWRSLR